MRLGSYIILICSLLLLAGCDFNKMYSRVVPTNVQEMDHFYLEALNKRDKSAFQFLQSEPDDEKFDKALEQMIDAVASGHVIRTDVVSVNSSTSITTSGKSKNIQTVFEVQKEGGFNLVTVNYSLDSDGKCCVLYSIYVAQHDESPHRAGLEKTVKIIKMFGMIAAIIWAILLLVILIYFHRKKKKSPER